MQCRYREKAEIAGDMIFGAVFAVWRKAGARRGKFRPSSATQQALNERHAREKMNWMIHANFDSSSYIMHPTYDAEHLPETAERFEADLRNLIGRARRLYARHDAELKWLAVRAFGEESGRPHLHVYFSGGVPWEELKALWKMGRVNADQLEFDECGVTDSAAYTFDQRHAGKRRWTGSRNLVQPQEKTDVSRYSKAAMEDLSEMGMADVHREFARRYPGYWLAEAPEIRRNGVDGSWYMTYVLYRPDSENLMPHIRKRNRKRYTADSDGVICERLSGN